jgi:hypothetical protein
VCETGDCIAGMIANKPIKVKDWIKANAEFLEKIDAWNEMTKRFEIPHIGYARRSNFCMTCGTALPEIIY